MNTILIDAGNTRIKFGVTLAGGGYRYLGACDAEFTIAEIGEYLAAINVVWTQALGVCVAGETAKQRIVAALHSFGVPIVWLHSGTVLPGLGNAYATPATLGSDRWLAAYGVACSQLAAGEPSGAPCVLASFGTATTVDLIDWDAAQRCHVFVGGIILAGLSASWENASYSTAQLPNVTALAQTIGSASAASAVIPNRTDSALLMGGIYAQAGAVAQFCQSVTRQYGAPTLFVAGGAARWVAPYLEPIQGQAYQAMEYPVLTGLAFARRALAMAKA